MGMKQLRGLYLVFDPLLGEAGLTATRAALNGGVDIVQLLDSKAKTPGYARILREITRTHNVPLLVNNDLALAREVGAEGVHIDGTRPLPSEVRANLGSDATVGYTCGNELEKVRWAVKTGADYVSFCSIFPSGSAGECELVPLETVESARKETRIPIFASGGINHENAGRVLSTGIDGIAVISAILKVSDPESSARRFKQILEVYRKTPISASEAASPRSL